jgi:localization factor PodJL
MSEGVDGSPDHVKAVQWFRTAADYGVKDSQYNLGVIYARGLGVGLDLAEAFKWFSIAAAQGDNDAATRRDDLAKAMTPEQLEKAQALLRAWHPKPALPDANAVAAPERGWEDPVGRVTEVDRKQLVLKIQTLLAEQGYDVGVADGVEGPKTREAVRAFQKTIGAAETGVIGGELLAALSTPSG